MGAYKECVASFHAFKKREYEAYTKEQATTPTSTTSLTTTKTTKIAIRKAIRQWASYQVIKQLEKEPKEIKATSTTSTITPIITTKKHATTRSCVEITRTTTKSESTTKSTKNLAIDHAFRV